MSASFIEINCCQFPEDVMQCSACFALVLSGNTNSHADWHGNQDRRIQELEEKVHDLDQLGPVS